jgi:ATP-dependent exoDNAse (exonuclease V) beta subunit
MLIRLVESIGAEAMHRTLGLAVDEKVADVVITTAHKAKGREWDGVSLAGDFKHPDDMDSDELRLLYVSVTRARKHLDITQLPEQQGDKPRLFNNPWTSASRDSTSGVKKQRPPIDINTKTSSVGPSPQRRGIIQRLLGD